MKKNMALKVNDKMNIEYFLLFYTKIIQTEIMKKTKWFEVGKNELKPVY